MGGRRQRRAAVRVRPRALSETKLKQTLTLLPMPKVTAGQLLFIAARDGDAAGAEKALAKRAPPDYRDNVEGMTPLHMACCNGNARVVELLLSKKASTSITTDGGSTPLALACINRHTSIVRMLLAAGASADQGLAVLSAEGGASCCVTAGLGSQLDERFDVDFVSHLR